MADYDSDSAKAERGSKLKPSSVYVIKRDGRRENVFFDKIMRRIQSLAWALAPEVEPAQVAVKVIGGIYSGVTTVALDELAAETAAHMVTVHPDYGLLASRIEVSNLHKNTDKVFSDVIQKLYEYTNPRTGKHGPLISDEVYETVMANKDRLNSAIVYKRDYTYDYFGIKTLQRAYLLKLNNVIAERPQHMLMRVSLGIHGADIEAAIETYNLMSEKWFTHASPTLFNAGTPRPQMSSCFLLQMQEDSIEGIYDTLKQCAQISKNAGGIGLAVHKIRSTGSYIRGTNGTSNGIVPMLRVFNNTARYVDQGGGKRKGSFAIYLEPWHPDIFGFLDLRKNTGTEEERARDLFLGLWVNDLFMRRVKNNEKWSLMCPNECPGLPEVWGNDFDELYESYELNGKFVRQIDARELWNAIIGAQIETGTPYMLYKDACNSKSNQRNLGTIQSSNLCTEIVEFTSPDEIAVCNLASIALPKFVNVMDQSFDFDRLRNITKVITRNLNKVIDKNFYPIIEAKNSNFRHRPIGIGVQGLADTFILLHYPFDSPEAQQLNRDIFETIYYAACEASCEIAMKEGPYDTFKGSPASEGKLQFDLWYDHAVNETLKELSLTDDDIVTSSASSSAGSGTESMVALGKRQPAQPNPDLGHDWSALKERIKKYGMRNSLLLAPMPTASTSQILGNNECFEPYTSNVYVRRTLSGDFVCINEHLVRDLIDAGIWSSVLKDKLIAANGSVQNLSEIPAELKRLYKTVWEVSQKVILDMAADRGAFIDQSQSLNIHMTGPSLSKLTSMHFHAWSKGLKTGMYYLRTKAAADAIKFTVDAEKIQQSTVAPTKPEPAPLLAASASPIRRSGSNGSITGVPSAGSRGSISSPVRGMISDDSKTNEAAELEARKQQALAKMMCSIKNKEACTMCSG